MKIKKGNKGSTILLLIILILLIGIIGITGYVLYSEIMGESTIEISFEEDSIIPTIQYKTTEKEDSNNYEEIIFKETSSGNGTTENAGNYKHLYNQLDKTAKIIYSKLYENRENLKTGTYTVEFKNTFSSLLSESGGDEELQRQYQSAIEALIYDNPDIFYIDATKMYINIEKITKITGIKYNVYINSGHQPNYLQDGFLSKSDVDAALLQIETIKNQILSKANGKSDYEKVKLVHDYLVETIDYETTISQDNIYDMYGALVYKKAVCEGYAKAFQYFMNELKVDNVIVIGQGTNSNNETESHAWNYVKLNENWYAVDTTWDDPVVIGGGKQSQQSKYQYFLKGLTTFNKSHIPSGRFTEGGQIFEYPTLSIRDYD
ncbi:MAG: hypothetical protein HFJ55_02750 [Clostridia bacterium]|nr:hypothetical protein [Clostridia bacterium]